MAAGVEIRGDLLPCHQALLSPPALAFLAHLHRMFEETRQSLLRARAERKLWQQQAWREGEAGLEEAGLGFAPESSAIRDGQWQLATTAAETARWEGPASGPCTGPWLEAASRAETATIRLSLEDALTPSFANLLEGQLAIRRALADGAAPSAILLLTPRGWHLPEAHLLVDGTEISAAIFDFGLHFFHNTAALLERGAAPAFTLPKLEHYLEARLWNNLFVLAQSILGLPLGTIRAAVEIETVPALFMAEEILYELRDHAVALGFDRNDYLFSSIRTFAADPTRLLPDLATMPMASPLLAAALRQLRFVCARRGAAFIGDAGNAGDTENAGSVPERGASAAELLARPEGRSSSAGLAAGIFHCIGYLASWLAGTASVEISGRTTDAATDAALAELYRSQLWQWRRHGAILEDGTVVSGRRLNSEIKAQLGRWRDTIGDEAVRNGRYREAATILLDLVLEQELPDFFTLPCYRQFLAG